jgi:hypothetical protein
MAMAGRSVFISYRRQLSRWLALLVRKDLIEHRFDAFMDVENLDSGEFERRILSEIEVRQHFVVLLEPGSLDQIGEDGDWLRREIAHALAHGRNVVPVTAKGFKFHGDLVLPPDVARLPSFNALSIQEEYFEAAMERLRTRFLKAPSKPPAPPLPGTRNLFERGRHALDRSGKLTSAGTPVLPAPQLTGRHGNPLQVQLTWTEVSGAHEYVLERAHENYRGDQEIFQEVYRGPDRSYNEIPAQSTGLGSWSYRVRAASASGQAGKWSDTLSLHTGF